MAQTIHAVTAYRPRIAVGRRVEMDDLVAFISRSTGLNQSGVSQALYELRDAVLFFARRGESVKLEGLGTYTPKIQLDGTLGIGHRPDVYLKRNLNIPHTFGGTILNPESIGSSLDELVARWNEEHPDDPVS